jgi:uridine kinase
MNDIDRYNQVRKRIDALAREKSRVICAIDGPCAGGKTTLGKWLQAVYDGNLFSMDDFFLQPKQRTPERLAQPGGNVDYERFKKEILTPLLAGETVFYRPFDCSQMELAGEARADVRAVNIIEGAYSLHPFLSHAYNLKIFLTVDKQTQAARLAQRNPRLLNRFINEWIPLEENYFNTFDIIKSCDLVL